MEFVRKLKVAQNIEDIADSFSAMALSTPEEMQEFYVETMDVRTGDPDDSPIAVLEAACCTPSERGAMLLLGHRGCGKSTELNDMRLRLEAQNRPVFIIQCEERLPLENKPRYSDLLILMGEALCELANKNGVHIDTTAEKIQKFWTPVKRLTEKVRDEEIDVVLKFETGTPSLLQLLCNFFLKFTTDLKFSDVVRDKTEDYIRINYAEWRTLIRGLSDAIYEKTRKQPVLIFEGLDHLEDLDEARKLFFDHADKLSDVSFPVIYTIPIALFYDPQFTSFDAQFRDYQIFPMMKLENLDGERYDKGIDCLKRIVELRAREGLIDADAVDLMIEKTGGSLRDLFRAIRDAAQMASYRGYRTQNPDETVTLKDAERALTKIQSNLSRRIEGNEHVFLAEICLGKKQKRKIEKQDTLLKMLQARTVLEYNSKRWFNVHPLIADYLEELEYIQRKDGKWVAGREMSNSSAT